MTQFREHEERHLASEIKIMRWNPKFDLIAIAFKSGDVALHRLVGWQKVWILPYSGPSKDIENNYKKNELDSSKDYEFKNSSKFDVFVNCLEWRPDGKVLAVGYNKNWNKIISDNYYGSIIFLVDVENGDVFKTIEVENGQVSCLTWNEFYFNNNENLKTFSYGCSPVAIEFLLKMIPIDKLYEDKNDLSNFYGSNQQVQRKHLDDNYEDILRVANQKSLNVLAVGTTNGFVELYLFGVYKCCLIECLSNTEVNYISFSEELDYLNVVYEDCENNENKPKKYIVTRYNIDNLKKKQEHYFAISIIYCKVKSLIQYLNDSIQVMYEIFENILLEIDNKLSSYLFKNQRKKDKKDKDVLLADEFLELLVFGNVTETLEKFLNDFFHRGLKKLGQSIETAYSNLQKLVVENLQRVTQHIFSYLHTLCAISKWTTDFSDLEIEPDIVNDALKSVGSFYLKTIEFQQVIDVSIRNVKCFFKWLYYVMLRVYGDSVPPSQQDLTKVSQQEIQFVADFIQENFENEDEQANLYYESDLFNFSENKQTRVEEERPTSSNFTLERVGQYLKEENLSYISPSLNDLSNNEWVNFIENNDFINNQLHKDILVYPHNNKNSLIQEYKHLQAKFESIYHQAFEKFCSKINMESAIIEDLVPLVHENSSKFSGISNYLSFVDNKNIFYLFKFDMINEMLKIMSLHFFLDDLEKELKILDFEFYNENIVSFLMFDPLNQNSYLFQFSLENISSSKNYIEMNLFTSYEEIMNSVEKIPIIIKDEVVVNSDNEPIIQLRKLENIRVSNLAVSGSRKVSCISSVSKKRVRIFEMDSCEDEETIEETIEETVEEDN